MMLEAGLTTHFRFTQLYKPDKRLKQPDTKAEVAASPGQTEGHNHDTA